MKKLWNLYNEHKHLQHFSNILHSLNSVQGQTFIHLCHTGTDKKKKKDTTPSSDSKHIGKQVPHRSVIFGSLSSDLNGFHIGLLHLLLRNSHSEHAVFHRSLDLIDFGVFRQPEAAEEAAAAAFHAVPLLVLVLLLLRPLSAYLKHPSLLDLHLHLFLLQPWKIRFEHVRLRSLLPVDARVGDRRSLVRDLGARKGEGGFKWVPDVKGEGVEDIGPSPCAEETWNERHCFARVVDRWI